MKIGSRVMIYGFRALLIHFLLSILNSRFLNKTPCKFGYIGNVDAFSADYLRLEDSQTPGITVMEVLKQAEQYAACPIRTDGGLMVIEADGSYHEATVWDLHNLRITAQRHYRSDAEEEG